MTDDHFIGNGNVAMNQHIHPVGLEAEPAQVEEGRFSDVEIRAREGIVIKTDRVLMTEEDAMRRKYDLEVYASRFNGTSIQLAPLLGVRVDREGDAYRVQHAVEYVQGYSILSLAAQSPAAKRAMAAEVVAAALNMPSMRYNRDHMPVGLDLLERNIQVAGIHSRNPGQLILVDMTPPIFRYEDGSLNINTDTAFWDRYFTTKSGAVARYLAHAFCPRPLHPHEARGFVDSLSDIIPRQWREPVIAAMESYAADTFDQLGSVACADVQP